MATIALVALPASRVQFLPTAATFTKAGGFAPVLAMGLANAVTTRLFMVSLQKMPLSLCHTLRSCSPCVAAVVGLWRGRRFSPAQLWSLPVIVAGFAIAVSAQPACSATGVCAAIGSLLAMSALQHLSKGLLEGGVHEMQCQFLQSTLCLVFLALSNYEHNSASFGAVRNLAMHDDGHGGHRRFRLLALVNGFSDYAENVAATRACAAFDELTFAVFDTVRRLSVILLCGFVARNNPARPSNVVGTLLVLAGALLYQHGSSNRNSNSESEDCDIQSAEKLCDQRNIDKHEIWNAN